MSGLLSPPEETLGRRAYCALRDQIVDGRLQPGQRLSLRSVASALGMSMAPVGEAFRDLARDGLIESRGGRSTRVRKLDPESLANQHILRMALECEAIRHCAQRATDSEVDELDSLAQRLDHLVERRAQPAEVCKLDSALHLRIAELSGSAGLVELLRANQLVRLLARGSLLTHETPRPPRDHGCLVDAIRSRDPDRAERKMRAHCVRSMQLQLAKFSVPGATPPGATARRTTGSRSSRSAG